MKRKFRFMVAAVGAVMMLALLAVAACTGGDGGKAKLTLDAGNGKLATSQYDLEAGADLYEFLKDKIPSPEDGLTFAAWYLNGKPIEEGATMSADGVTVTAKYGAVRLHP